MRPCSSPRPASAKSNAEEALRKRQAQVQQQKQALDELTAQERLLHKDMAQAEDRLKQLGADIKTQEDRLAAIEKEGRQNQEHLAQLLYEKRRTGDELRLLMGNLWPLYVQKNMVDRGRNFPSWDKADREFAWTAQIYRTIQDKLSSMQQQQKGIEQSLGRKQTLASEIRTQLSSINQAKASLLDDKLAFMRRLKSVRQEKTDRESELNMVLAAIQSLNTQIKQEREAVISGDMNSLKGRLPWPIRGKVVQRFNPSAKPPCHGLGVAGDGRCPDRGRERGQGGPQRCAPRVRTCRDPGP